MIWKWAVQELNPPKANYEFAASTARPTAQKLTDGINYGYILNSAYTILIQDCNLQVTVGFIFRCLSVAAFWQNGITRKS